ncbi:MAG: glycosyltransferase [Candidatus Heimdallarchaeota archaeon]
MSMGMNRRMRILMLSLHGYVSVEPELGKPDTGGQVTFILELAKRFSRLGHNVDLITRQFEDQVESELVNDNFRILRIPFGGKDFIRKEDMHDYLGDFITNFLAKIRSVGLEYDVISSHYWDAGWAGQRTSEELQIIHVHTPHSLGWWKRAEMEQSKGEIEGDYRFKERINKEYRIYQSCDHIIATTDQQKEIIAEQYDVPERHVTVIPPGINENQFYPLPSAEIERIREKYNLREEDVLLLGRLAENKGYDLFIKCMPILQKLVPDIRAVLALGTEDSLQDQEFTSQLKELAGEVNVADLIEWRYFIPDEDLADVYRGVGVFVMPSRYEPFGMTAVEAMACGTPTVITRNGALHENLRFGSHALFVDPEIPLELAVVVSLPFRHPELHQELSREGARMARRRFGWTGIARSTLEIFSAIRHVRRFEEEEV